MHDTVRLLCLSLAAGLLVLPSLAEEPAPRAVFAIEPIATGVHLFTPPAGRDDLTNSLVVERDDGLLVVGAQPTPDAARLLLTQLAGLGAKQPRYLVLPHPHAEAAGGAAAFPEATLIIGTDGCRTALADDSFDFAAEARARAVARRESAWKEPPRPAPVLVLHGRTRLDDSRNPVELLPAALSHSSGDLMVQLPQENVVFAGALLFADGNPYVAGGNVGGWLSLLNHLARNRPALVIPLRGPAKDAREMRTMRDSLAWLRGQVDLAFIDEVPSERIPDRILGLEETANRFNIEAKPSFLRELVRQAVREAVEKRAKRGLN